MYLNIINTNWALLAALGEHLAIHLILSKRISAIMAIIKPSFGMRMGA